MNQFVITSRLRGKGVYGLLTIVLLAGILGGLTRTAQAAGASPDVSSNSNIANPASLDQPGYTSQDANASVVYATGASWYLDSQATGNNSGTSWANAWTSPASVNFGSMASGDTLYISGGSTSQTYSGTLKIPAGKSGITITKGIDAGHNGEVVFNGNKSTQYGVSINATGTAVKNVTIANITFKAYTGAGVYGNGQNSGGLQNITVNNCKFLDFQRSGVFFEGNNNLNGNFGIVVKNSYFDDDNSFTSQSDGIYVQVLKDFTADHNKIILDNNYTGTADLHSDNIQAFWVDNVTYSNNYLIHKSNKTLGTQMLFTENGYGLHVFYNNILIRDEPSAQDSAFRLKTGGDSTFTAKVIGNTYIGRGRIINSSVATVFKNNIFEGLSQPSTSQSFYSIASGSTASNNLFYDPNNQFPTVSSGGKEGDPMFVSSNFSSIDLHLKSGSPAINGGASIGSPFDVDADGNSRGSTVDIGAYEYGGSSAPAPTATKAPTQAPTATKAPTLAPTPTKTATKAPTLAPTATKAPTLAPTATKVPTQAPTATKAPTQAPTATKAPTQSPTATKVPTQGPTPTKAPTTAPTTAPTQAPPASSNDDANNATVISSSGGNFTYSNTIATGGATTSTTDPYFPFSTKKIQGYHTVWYTFTAGSKGTLVASTTRSNYDTLLGVWTKDSTGAWKLVKWNDNSSTTRNTSSLSFTTVAGTTYYFEAAAKTLTAGTLVFNMSYTPVVPTNDLVSKTGYINSAKGAAFTVKSMVDVSRAKVIKSEPVLPDGRGRNYRTVWYKFLPVKSGTITISTSGSNYDTVAAAWKYASKKWNAVGMNDDWDGKQAGFQMKVTAGTRYLIGISSNSQTGPSLLKFSLDFKPD